MEEAMTGRDDRSAFAPKSLIFSRSIGVLAVVVGSVVVYGWMADVAALRSLLPGFPQMKLNAAVAFMLAGVSLWLLSDRARAHGVAARACAVGVALIGLLTLLEYAFGWAPAIDELVLADHTADGPFPGRIPVAGALNFLLLGALLGLLDTPWSTVRHRQKRWPAQWLALLIAVISFVVLLGFIYGATSLYRPRLSNPVALHGIVLFMLLALGALIARSDRGVVARVISADADGLLLRRMLPAVIVIPPTLGWLRLQGQEAGLYGTDLGLAIFATTNVLVLCGLIWITASLVRRAEVERRTAADKLRDQVARLDLLNHITHAIGERQDLRSIFQVVVRSLEDHLPIDFGCVCLYEAATETMTIANTGTRNEELALEFAMPEHASIPVDSNGLARSVAGTLVYEPDIGDVPFPFPQRLARTGLHALIIAPLRTKNTVFGVLVAARRQAHSFSSGECEFLQQLCEHVALATHQGQLNSALQSAYDDLRQSRQTLTQQERLRALGQMASGIAHDINNALSPISLYTASLLEREAHLSRQGREQLGTISRAIDDVADTVARLREFSRPREAQLRLTPIDLNGLVRQVLELTRVRWRDLPQERGIVIDVRVELEKSVPIIQGAEAEIRDALTNLIFNAIDAMPQGGVLTVSTLALHERTTLSSLGERVGHLCVAITDTGAGMDEETRRHCLEPFFTTKGERGTGLGLAMVYGMAQRHGAELEIQSVLGVGTTLRLIFPVTIGELSAAPRAVAPARAKRRLRILVIDDDPLLIQSLRNTLEGDGHDVRTADGGQAGIDEFLAAQKRHEPFTIVITDLGMPYVDGRKVASTLRAAASDTLIIMLTGWGQRMLSDGDTPPDVDRVLAKPPKLSELRAALAELTAQIEDVSAHA